MKLCDYGCGQEAKYPFKNGKWCCSEHYNRCPPIQKKMSKVKIGKKTGPRSKETKKKISEVGKRIAEIRELKEQPISIDAKRADLWRECLIENPECLSCPDVNSVDIESFPVYVLPESLKSIIGENGLERFNEFKTHYKDGWDFGKGKALSPFSTRSLIMFFDRVGSFNNEPSLFLTRNGNLQIVWEDKHNNTIDIEFFKDKIEYYIESEDLEGQVNLDDINDLVSLLSQL